MSLQCTDFYSERIGALSPPVNPREISACKISRYFSPYPGTAISSSYSLPITLLMFSKFLTVYQSFETFIRICPMLIWLHIKSKSKWYFQSPELFQSGFERDIRWNSRLEVFVFYGNLRENPSQSKDSIQLCIQIMWCIAYTSNHTWG